VLVEEAKRYTIAYGGGFEVQRLASTTNPTGEKCRPRPRYFGKSPSSISPVGRIRFSLKLRGSTLQGRALLGYSVRHLRQFAFEFSATAFVEKTQDIIPLPSPATKVQYN